jgi:hypothetical protein
MNNDNEQLLAFQLNRTAIVSQHSLYQQHIDTSIYFYCFKIEQLAFRCFSTAAGFKRMLQLGALRTQPIL